MFFSRIHSIEMSVETRKKCLSQDAAAQLYHSREMKHHGDDFFFHFVIEDPADRPTFLLINAMARLAIKRMPFGGAP